MQLPKRYVSDDFDAEVVTHHFFSKQIEALQSAHCLCTRLNIAEDNMCLATHDLVFCSDSVRDNVEDRSVCREEHVQSALEIALVDPII